MKKIIQMTLEIKPILSKTAYIFLSEKKIQKLARAQVTGQETACYEITIFTPSNRVSEYQLRKPDEYTVDKVDRSVL